MATIAVLIARALRCRADDAELAAVRDDVVNLCSKFTPYAWTCRLEICRLVIRPTSPRFGVA